MFKKYSNKFVSILITLAMVLNFMSAATLNVNAAGVTGLTVTQHGYSTPDGTSATIGAGPEFAETTGNNTTLDIGENTITLNADLTTVTDAFDLTFSGTGFVSIESVSSNPTVIKTGEGDNGIIGGTASVDPDGKTIHFTRIDTNGDSGWWTFTGTITWTFTASVSTDTTAPTLSSTIASDITSTDATLNFTSNEAGTCYYLVYAAADSAPNAATVKAQGTAVAKGTSTAFAAANTASVSGLTASTAYKAYVIVEDAASNKSEVATIAFSTIAPLSSDATLKATSTVKGQTVTSLGIPNAVLGSETAGSVTITAAKAADTSNIGSFITLFDKNDSNATVKVVKYASGASTAGFATDAAYANEAISNGDFFIIKVTAQDTTTVNYYRINIMVTPAVVTAPTFTSSTTSSFAENATGTVYTATATPSTGGGTVSYSLTGGSDQALFSINSPTGAVTFKGSPDYEKPTDTGKDNTYNITVTATDSNGSTPQDVAITVTDINDVNFTTADNTVAIADMLTQESITKSVTAGGTANIIFKDPSDDGYVWVYVENDVNISTLNDKSPGGIYSWSGNNSIVTLYVTAQNGYTFDLSSFKFAADKAGWGMATVDVSYISGGTPYSQSFDVTQDCSLGYTTVNSFTYPVNDVTQVVITVDEGFAEFQDFEITDIKTALSSDAGLTSVLGQAIMAGSEAGTSGAPKTASISVANGVPTVTAADIVKHDAGATVTFYGTDSTFNTIETGSINLTAGSGTNVYIKVAAADNTTLYYKVTINRAVSLTDMNITGVRFATFDITQNPMIATIDVEMTDIGLNADNFTITDDSNPGSTVTINNAAYSGGKYTLTVSGMSLYDSYTLGITKAGYADYSNNHFYGTLAAAGDIDLVNEPNIFPTYTRKLTEAGVVTIKNQTYAAGAKLYSGAVYNAIDGNNGNPDNGTVTRLIGIFAKAPDGAKAVKTLRPSGQVLQVAGNALIDGNPNYQETVQNGKDYYNAHKDDPGFVDNGYWKTLAFVPIYSQIATERQSDNSRILVDPADRFRIIEWYDNEACTGNPVKVIRLMVKVDYTGSVTVEADTPPAPTATGGEEYIDVTNVVPGAALKLYTTKGTLISSTYIDMGNGIYRFENVLPHNSWYYVTQSVGGYESSNSQFVNPSFRIPSAIGGVEYVDVTNVSSNATIRLYKVGGGIISDSPTPMGNGTYRFENVTPDSAGFYVTQYANNIESANCPFFGVSLRTPSISGGNRQITVSNIFPGADVTLYDSHGNEIETADSVTAATHQFNNVDLGSGYYVQQTINGVISLPSNGATVYSEGPRFVGGTQSITVRQYPNPTDLRDQLYVSDLDAGQTLTWTVVSGPSHGTLNDFPATASTNGSGGIYGTVGSTDTRIPTAVTYTPAEGYVGSDSFTIQVSDGIATDTRVINVGVNLASGSEVTAVDSAQLAAAINNPEVGIINLNSGTRYQIGGAEINRPLTIRGNGAMVEALNGVGQSFDDQTIYHLGMPDGNNNRRYRGNIFWYVKDGGSLNVENLILRNAATSENAQGLTGIFAAILLNDDADLSLSGVAFEDFWFENSKLAEQNNLYAAQGLYATYSDLSYGVYADYNCTGNITISGSTFGSSNAFRDAVHIYKGNNVAIDNSTFIGTSHPERLRAADGYEYGIYLYGGNCTVTNNEISNYDNKTITGYFSSGIALGPYNDVNATIEDNIIQGNDAGLDLAGGWKALDPDFEVIINEIELSTEDNGFKIGEELKASNTISGSAGADIFIKLDQNDDDNAFVYYSPFLSISGTNTTKPTLNFSQTAGATGLVTSAITIEVEKSEDNGQSWTTASVEGTLDNSSTSAVVILEDNKTYSLRVKMTHNNNQTPNTVITGYSNAVTFTTASLSSDAGLTSVLGQTIAAGSEAGTSVTPKTATITVANGVATIATADIVKSDAGAIVTFYGTDSSFTTPAVDSVNLTPGGATDVYIKVVAVDGTTLYYMVTINRAAPADGTAPTINAYMPTNNATEVAVDGNLVLTFSENVTSVVGKNIVIKKTSDDSVVETIEATDAKITVSGSTVTINPSADLYYSTEYYVQIDAGAFKNAGNINYAGISDNTTWSLTTEIRSEVTANTSVELAHYIANPNISIIDLVNGTTYQYDGGTISRDLTINGNGAVIQAGVGVNDTVVRSDDVTVSSAALANYANVKTFLKIEGVGSALKLKDVTLKKGANYGIFAVINVKTNGSLDIDNVTLEDFHNNPTPGNNLSFGIHAEPGAISTTIKNSKFESSNAFRNAVAIRNGAIQLYNNTFEGTDYPERLRQSDGYEYAIYIYGGNGTVTQNTITSYDSTTQQGYASAGIAVIGFYSTEVTIENNALSYNESGIDITRTWAPWSTNTHMRVNGQLLTSSADAYAIGEALKAANTQEYVSVSLDQNDEVQLTNSSGGQYFAVLGGYRSPFLTVTNIAGNTATVQLPVTDADTLNAADSIEFEMQVDGGTNWTGVNPTWVVGEPTKAILTLGAGHQYRIRVKMTHTSYEEQGDPARILITYSNPVIITVNSASSLTHDVAGNAKTFNALTAGYAAGARETLTVTVTSTGTNNNVTAALSGADAASFTLTESIHILNNAGTGTFTVVPNNGLAAGTYNATVTITSDEYPAGISFTVQQVVNAPGTLAFSSATYSVVENGTSVTITVNRIGGSDGSVTVDYATSNGTATAGSDYTSSSGTLTFANGEISKTFTVIIADDATYEGNETINLTLSNQTGGATLGAQNTATLTITDNEVAQPGTLAFSSATYSVAEGETSVTITVNRDGGSDGSVTVDYATSNGTATAGSDYTAASGTLTFGNGETSKTFTVSVKDDATYEGNETVNLTLSNQTGGAVLGAQNTATLTITDNEIAQPSAPTIQSAVAGDARVSITWSSVAGATGYKVYSSTTSGSYGAALATVGGSFYSYDAISLTNGTTYYFVVKAINGSGDSINSNEVSATPQVAAPGAPVLQTAVAGDGHVNVTWNAVAGSTGYKVYASTTSGSYTTPVTTVTGSVYSSDVTGLTNGTTYYFVVKATNPGGDSAISNEVSAMPQVSVPSAPAGVTATGRNAKVTLNWNSVIGATGYKIYQSTTSGSYGAVLTTVTGSVYSYEATGLTNGVTYYFVIKATNPGGDSPNSAEVSAMPKTVPGAPTNVTAAAGNGEATVSFASPIDNGGSPITGYIVTSNPGNITATGMGTTITVTGLTNGTTYTFTVKAVNEVGNGQESGASNSATPYKPSNGGSSGGSSTPSTPAETGFEILVNGKAETAATVTTAKEGDKTVTTVTVDDKKVEETLQKEGNKAAVTIPVKNDADVVVGQLNGQTVKNMENKEAVLEIKTGNVTYTLPASHINIDNVSVQIGKQVELKDISVNVKISVPPQETAKIVEDTANKNNYQVVVKPVEFEITCTSGNKTVEVSKFNGYVERMVAIPEGVDPNKITTGIVLNPDGTFSHVPTIITIIDGKYYAKINSLTNSTYSVIWSPKTFKDVENHWAKDAVNDMGSRLVISGVGEDRFEPDRDITRAEFAAIVVRALGLMRPGAGKDAFGDVPKDAWYYDAVSIAYEYGIISGYGNGKFGPMDKITREQAMTMIARAMKITKLNVEFKDGEAAKLLTGFGDTYKSAEYARDSIAACIKTGIVSGRNGSLVAPKDNITRAEVAAIVRRLLQKSNLI